MNKNENDGKAKNETGNAANTNERSVDLSVESNRKNLAKIIKEEIDHYCKTAYDDGHRNHLGASLIGHECERFLWYIFRWCFASKFDGRMQRLFNRGHREEERFLEWLKGCGFQVWADDLDNNALLLHSGSGEYLLVPRSEVESYLNGPEIVDDVSQNEEHVKIAKALGVKFPQYRMSGCGGHFGGSLDGVAKFPPEAGIDEPVLLEFKTNCTGAGFSKLFTDGVEMHKPQHFIQNSTYGYKYGFNYCLYLNINKNDDDIYVELVKLKHETGQQSEMKANKIICSQTPPAKLSPNPTYFKCKNCDARGICHGDDFPEKNCRSCKYAKPIDGAQWECEFYGEILTKDKIVAACEDYIAITTLE